MRDADVIEIRGLRAVGLIGANPEEQERAQPFEIDLDLYADLSVAAATDELGDTINYGDVVTAAACVVETERHQLLEQVAQRVADEVLAVDERATSVRVTIRKLRPPVPFDVATAGVTITRARA